VVFLFINISVILIRFKTPRNCSQTELWPKKITIVAYDAHHGSHSESNVFLF